MGRLVLSGNVTLDGYTVDAEGSFDWGVPHEDLLLRINELERPIGTYLYGRRMYEVMSYWEATDLTDAPYYLRDYADIWQAADKVVFSRTLTEPATRRTRLIPEFDADEVAELVRSSPTDVSIGGPTIAVPAFAAGLVDEVRLFVHPVSVGGGGLPLLPQGQRLDLTPIDEESLGSGVVILRYTVNRD